MMISLILLLLYLSIFIYCYINIVQHLTNQKENKNIKFKRYDNGNKIFQTNEHVCNLKDLKKCTHTTSLVPADVGTTSSCKCHLFSNSVTEVLHLDNTTTLLYANDQYLANIMNERNIECETGNKFGDNLHLIEVANGVYKWKCSCTKPGFFVKTNPNDLLSPCRKYLGCITKNSLPFDPVEHADDWQHTDNLHCNCNETSVSLQSTSFAPQCKTTHYFKNKYQLAIADHYLIDEKYIDPDYIKHNFINAAVFKRNKGGKLPNPCYFDFYTNKFIDKRYIDKQLIEIVLDDGVAHCRVSTKTNAFVAIRFANDYLRNNNGQYANGIVQVQPDDLIEKPDVRYRKVYETNVWDSQFNRIIRSLRGQEHHVNDIKSELADQIPFLIKYTQPFSINTSDTITKFMFYNAPMKDQKIIVEKNLAKQLHNIVFHRVYMDTKDTNYALLGMSDNILYNTTWTWPIDFYHTTMKDDYSAKANPDFKQTKRNFIVSPINVNTQNHYARCIRNNRLNDNDDEDTLNAKCKYTYFDDSLVPIFIYNRDTQEVVYNENSYFYTGMFIIDQTAYWTNQSIQPLAPNQLTMIPKVKQLFKFRETTLLHQLVPIYNEEEKNHITARLIQSHTPFINTHFNEIFNWKLYNLPTFHSNSTNLVKYTINTFNKTIVPETPIFIIENIDDDVVKKIK